MAKDMQYQREFQARMRAVWEAAHPELVQEAPDPEAVACQQLGLVKGTSIRDLRKSGSK